MGHKPAVHISVNTSTYLLFAALALLVPLRLLTAWMIAVIFHEACHWLAVKLCGGEVFVISVGVGGAIMESSPLPEGKALIAIFAGPLGGFILAAFGNIFPMIALCSFLLSLYNLLPVYPLDGGRALKILVNHSVVFYVIQRTVIFLLVCIGIYACFLLKLGVLPLLITGGLWFKSRKIPCKEGVCGVQ